MRIGLNYNLYEADAPELTGDIVADLMRGSKIVGHAHDGLAWHILVEREGKLKDMNGREDNTWKYGLYQTSDGKRGEFWLASSYNHTSHKMDKKFWEILAEDRDLNRHKTKRVRVVITVPMNGRHYIVVPTRELSDIFPLIDGIAVELPLNEEGQLSYTQHITYTAESLTHQLNELGELVAVTEWDTTHSTVGEMSANQTAGRTDVPAELR